MEDNLVLVKTNHQFATAGIWVEATASYVTFFDYRLGVERENCVRLRIPTGTEFERQRCITALRGVTEFLESKLDSVNREPMGFGSRVHVTSFNGRRWGLRTLGFTEDDTHQLGSRLGILTSAEKVPCSDFENIRIT